MSDVEKFIHSFVEQVKDINGTVGIMHIFKSTVASSNKETVSELFLLSDKEIQKMVNDIAVSKIGRQIL